MSQSSKALTTTPEEKQMAGQFDQALQQLDQVIQQNAAAAEEIACTSEGLSAQAAQLPQTSSFFQLPDGGEPPAAHRPFPPRQGAPRPGLTGRTTPGQRFLGGAVIRMDDDKDKGNFEPY